MKIITPILAILIFVSSQILFSQNKYSDKRNNPNILEAVNIVNPNYDFRNDSGGSVKTVLRNSGANTTNASAPQGSRRYIRVCYLITPAEMLHSQFVENIVESVGWTWIALLPQDSNTTGKIKVYLQNTKDTIYNKGLNFSTAIDSMTKVIDGTIPITNERGISNIYRFDAPAGGSGTSPFATSQGSGVYVAFDYETTSPLTFPFGAPTVSCNDSLNYSIGFYTSQTDTGNELTLSNLRPETRFGDAVPYRNEVSNIYALGKIPFPWGFPDTIGIRLQFREELLGSRLQLGDSLNVRSINNSGVTVFDTTFGIDSSDTLLNVALLRQTMVNPSQSELVIVQAIPGARDNQRDILPGHQLQYCHDITDNAYNYADPCLPKDGGVGFPNGSSGYFVAGFSNFSSQPFRIDAVDHCFINALNSPAQPYQIVIYGDSSGKPGESLYVSNTLWSPVGNTYSQSVTHLTPSIVIQGNSRFYVGYRQINSTNISACYQNEIPIRRNTFFVSTTAIINSWVDFAVFPQILTFRLDISPRTCKNLKLKVYLQGFYDAVSNITMQDTLSVYLRNVSSPFAVVDSAKSVLTSDGGSTFCFANALDSIPYYIAVHHRNSIETWSKTAQQFTGNYLEYNFSSSNTKAYGDNQIQVDDSPVAFAIYSAEVSQDDYIDLTDLTLVINDARNFVTGYVKTDVTGDNIVDLRDVVVTFNNSCGFVSSVRPLPILKF